MDFLEKCSLRPCYTNNEFMSNYKNNKKIRSYNDNIKPDILEKKTITKQNSITKQKKIEYITWFINNYETIECYDTICDYTTDEDSLDEVEYETYYSD